MKPIILIACFAALVTTKYTNYKVYRVIPSNVFQRSYVFGLEGINGIEFWPQKNNYEIDIEVSPQLNEEFISYLTERQVPYSILIDNLQKFLDLENPNKPSNCTKKHKFNFYRYNSYKDIVKYLHHLQKKYPNITNVTTIGPSYEKRNVTMIKISSGGSGKPTILIDGGIHAREWVAPASVVYFIHQLVENQTNHYMFESIDWYIIPIVNPDGYEFSRASLNNVYWRKTRSRSNSTECIGVDANRNFDVHWMESGSSDDPCKITYAGPEPFSEVETRNLKGVVESLGNCTKLYLTFHSFGPLILYPWGYNTDLPKDWETLDKLGRDVSKAIYSVRGTNFTVGTSARKTYPAAGGSDDWIKAVGGVNLSYTIELPPGGSRGFNPLTSSIRGIAVEAFEGVRVYHAYVEKNFEGNCTRRF